MYRSLTDNESYIKRVKKLIQIQTNKKLAYDVDASKFAINVYNRLSKRKEAEIPGEGLVGGSVMFAYLITKTQINDKLRVVIHKNQQKRISDEKEAFIMSDINKNRIKKHCFYLCSKHSDSAKDHKPYQGKIYIDEKWMDYVDNPGAVKNYIHKHHIHEYQWVLGKPVYMLTRPHCRHYMTPLSEKEVLGNGVNYLLNKYDMYKPIGRRGDTQTLSSRGKEIESMITAYKDRLQLHREMYKTAPNDFLKAAINKDLLLLRKWIVLKK